MTICGLFPALSVMVTAPVRVLPTVGVKVTLIVQFAVMASELGTAQVLVWAKSPLALMLVMFRGALPVFVNVTTCGVGLVVVTI